MRAGKGLGNGKWREEEYGEGNMVLFLKEGREKMERERRNDTSEARQMQDKEEEEKDKIKIQ